VTPLVEAIVAKRGEVAIAAVMVVVVVVAAAAAAVVAASFMSEA
jgi:hypothetical protein